MTNRIKKSVGLDISSRSIEAVELSEKNNEVKVVSTSRMALTKGIVEQGRIKNMPALAKAVKNVLAEAKPQPIRTDRITFAYPEAQTYMRVISLNTSEKEINAQIKEQVLTALPIKESNLQYNYRILKPGNDLSEEQKALLLATNQLIVMEWQQFFSRLDLKIVGFTSESVAAYFGLFNKLQKGQKCIIDLGAKTVISSFFNANGLVYAFSYYLAGDYLTKEIKKAQNIDYEEAERLKINIGPKAKKETKEIINKYFKAFGAELKANFKEYQKYIGSKPNEIILVGGGAKLRGVEDLISSAGINISVRTGRSNLLEHEGLEFVSAVGLARLGLDPRRNMDNFLAWDKSAQLGKSMAWHCFTRARKKFNKPSTISAGFFRMVLGNAKLLIALGLIVGSIIIFSSYLLINTGQSSVPKAESKYSFFYTLPLSVPISILTDRNESAVGGRVYEVVVKEAVNLETAVSRAREQAMAALEQEEALWPEPLNDFSSSLIFPLSISFLVYNDREARAGLNDAASETLNGNNFLIDNMIFNKLTKDFKENKYILEAKVRLHSNVTPNILEEKKQKIIDKNKISMLLINDIGQTLNIRSGPGTDYAVVGKALSGGYYELLKTGRDWHEIKFNKVSNGWVYADFTTIVEE